VTGKGKKCVSKLRSPCTKEQPRTARVWCVSYYDDQGQRVRKSTGEATKPQAMKAALRMVSRQSQDAPTLREYTRTFYVWGECSWIKRQHAKGKGFNRQWAQSLRAMLVNHVLPRFGSMKLDALNRPMIEKWLVDLPLSNQTKNHCMYMMRNVLREAAAEGIIKANPLKHAEPMGKTGRKRDVFSLDELQSLFPPTREGLLAIWRTPKYVALFQTMASTGIREGEARALLWRHVLPAGWLVVELAVKEDATVGRPKNGEARVVKLPPKAQEAVGWWHEKSPFKAPSVLVFFGTSATRPLNRRTFQDILGRALDGDHRDDASKPPRVVREGRYLTTHSFRHTFNTMMRRVLPADHLQALMGHKDGRMSEHYDHPDVEAQIKYLETSQTQIEQAFTW
jgi:integrase